MEYIIREIKKSEYPLLDNFLYEAIFVPEGMDAPKNKRIQKSIACCSKSQLCNKNVSAGGV